MVCEEREARVSDAERVNMFWRRSFLWCLSVTYGPRGNLTLTVRVGWSFGQSVGQSVSQSVGHLASQSVTWSDFADL